jgi:hypothetical protein
MKKLICLAVLCFGFVGCGGGPIGTPEERAKTMGNSTAPAGAPVDDTKPAEGTAPAEAPKEGEAPADPAPPAAEAAEAK